MLVERGEKKEPKRVSCLFLGLIPHSYQVINLIKNDFWSQVAVKSLKNDKILVPENPVKPAPGPGIRRVRLRMGEIRIRGAGSEP
jgi:hypothetical protein